VITDTNSVVTYIPTSIRDYLGNGYTVNDLLVLANNALSGKYVPSGNNPTYSEIVAALDGFVEAFHDCRILLKVTENLNKRQSRIPDDEETISLFDRSQGVNMGVHPNPFSGDLTIQITVEEEGDYALKMYNTIGQIMVDATLHLYQGETIFMLSDLPELSNLTKINKMDNLPEAMYFLVVEGKNGSANQKVIKKSIR
jgi:hypothetical protein